MRASRRGRFIGRQVRFVATDATRLRTVARATETQLTQVYVDLASNLHYQCQGHPTFRPNHRVGYVKWTLKKKGKKEEKRNLITDLTNNRRGSSISSSSNLRCIYNNLSFFRCHLSTYATLPHYRVNFFICVHSCVETGLFSLIRQSCPGVLPSQSWV